MVIERSDLAGGCRATLDFMSLQALALDRSSTRRTDVDGVPVTAFDPMDDLRGRLML